MFCAVHIYPPSCGQAVAAPGDDPLHFVIATNLHRRHLSESQRAMIAAKLQNMQPGRRTDLRPASQVVEVSQKRAAAMLNVSTGSVINARSVLSHGTPELAAAVAEGKIKAKPAANSTAED